MTQMHNPPHPGTVFSRIAQYLDAHEVSERLKLSPQELAEFEAGTRPVTPELSQRIAGLLDKSPDLWLKMQQEYDAFQK
jgi:antitoxin HigA-1